MTFGKANNRLVVSETNIKRKLPGAPSEQFNKLPYKARIDGPTTYDFDTRRTVDNDGWRAVFYFFHHPDEINPTDLNAIDPNYLPLRVVETGQRYNRLRVAEKIPYSLSTIPIHDAQYVSQGVDEHGNELFSPRYVDDPILDAFQPDEKGRKPLPQQRVLTPVIRYNPDGTNLAEVEIMFFKARQWKQFLKWIQNERRRDSDFSIVGKPIHLVNDGDVLDVWIDTDYPELDLAENWHPVDVEAYILDLRSQVEEWLAEHGHPVPAFDDGTTPPPFEPSGLTEQRFRPKRDEVDKGIDVERAGRRLDAEIDAAAAAEKPMIPPVDELAELSTLILRGIAKDVGLKAPNNRRELLRLLIAKSEGQ